VINVIKPKVVDFTFDYSQKTETVTVEVNLPPPIMTIDAMDLQGRIKVTFD